jgi:transcriptional regulatory protein RtcR
MKKKIVVYGVLGTGLDRPGKWRPTLNLFRQPGLDISRLHLIHAPKDSLLAHDIKKEIEGISSRYAVTLEPLDIKDPWDFEEIYKQFNGLFQKAGFDTGKEEYLFHMTTGTHIEQICGFIYTQRGYFPGRLIQLRPQEEQDQPVKEKKFYNIVDLQDPRFDTIFLRSPGNLPESVRFLKQGIETRNDKYNSLIERIARQAGVSQEPILLLGATGTGKSELAELIYQLKRTQQHLSESFVAINCGSLRGEELKSELFGHKKGAFTGASTDRKGAIVEANGGVLFLDEIGELSPDAQAMLLRAIEKKKVKPMGSDREETSNFQLICGTNRNLDAEVREGRFREDLLARIKLWTYRLPSLNERLDDIEPNIDYELKKFEKEHGSYIGFDKSALDLYLKFAHEGTEAPFPLAKTGLWRANFRDLNYSIKRMCTNTLICGKKRITRDIVKDEITELAESWAGPGAAAPDPLIPSGLNEFDRIQLKGVLAICRESSLMAEAARRLFGASKTQNPQSRLSNYLKRYDISAKDIWRP